MLKSRVLTACILVPLVLALIFFAPSVIFFAAGLLLLLGCGIEWTALIPLQDKTRQFFFIIALFLSMWLSTRHYLFYQTLGLLGWAFIFCALIDFPDSQAFWGKRRLVACSGVLLLPLCWFACAQLYLLPQGSALILYLLLLVWATDTGAYFAGKAYGKHKLIPLVSPGKTVEGALGGLLSALLVSLAASVYFAPRSLSLWFIQAIVTTLMSMIGDLFISMLKRRVKCKDTGRMLPGHGGLLDRLDSLIAAAPVFYLLRPY